MLAPGVKQEIKMAVTRDDKQIVYYLATADITRSDVSVHANYNDNDGSVWKMARLSDQMKAAEKSTPIRMIPSTTFQITAPWPASMQTSIT